MSARFEELGWQQTPMGVISLRRRFDLSVRANVYEVKLDDEYLMSSLFTVAERELARLALARTPGPGLDVIVGGLGLGYTAQEALECKRIRTLTVIEYSDRGGRRFEIQLRPSMRRRDRRRLVVTSFTRI